MHRNALVTLMVGFTADGDLDALFIPNANNAVFFITELSHDGLVLAGEFTQVGGKPFLGYCLSLE